MHVLFKDRLILDFAGNCKAGERAHVAQRVAAYARQRRGLRAESFQPLAPLCQAITSRHLQVGHGHLFGSEARIEVLQVPQAAHKGPCDNQ